MRPGLPGLNIAQRFLGYLMFLSIIPLLIVGLTSWWKSSEVIQSEARRSTSQLVTNQRDYLELELSQLQDLLINVSSVDGIQQILTGETASPQNAYTRLSTQAEIGYILNGYINLTGLISIDIFTINGNHYHVGDTLDTENIREDAVQRIFATTFKDAAPIAWIGVEDNVNASSTHKKVLVVSRGISRIDSEKMDYKPVAAFAASYSVEEIYAHLQKIDMGENGYMVVTDAQNRIIYHPNLDLIGTTSAPAIMGQFETGDGSITASVDDTDMLISYSISPVSGWKLAGFVPLSTLADKTSVIGGTTMLLLLISFVIVVVAAILFNRDVVVPVREITNRFKRLPYEESIIQQKMQVRSSDEIGQLVQWFNTFLESLVIRQQTENQLRTQEEERKKLIEQLEASLRFKDQFLATMSHELRTPLNAIQGYSGLIASEEVSDDIRYMAERILANSSRLLSLIIDVLDISRLNAERIEIVSRPVLLAELVRNWYNDFLPQASTKNLAFDFELDPALDLIALADEARLTQIIANLLQNALKFTHTGRIGLAARKGDTTWKIIVSDTGIGIPEDWLQLIFEEFRQVDSSSGRKFGGAGLGLSIVKKLCILTGGNIAVTSEPGKGSTFTVTMPLITAKNAVARSDQVADLMLE